MCKNLSVGDSAYCSVHISHEKNNILMGSASGAILSLFLPGGALKLLLGTTVGAIIGDMRNEKMASKTKVFISFDFDEDRALKEFIIGQSKNPDSPFTVVDHSLKEAAPEKDWKDKARAAIKRSDVVLVMVGPKTHKAPGVLEEIRMAREENKRIVQVIGYKDGDYTPVPNAGRLYSWNWENLKKILS